MKNKTIYVYDINKNQKAFYPLKISFLPKLLQLTVPQNYTGSNGNIE